MPRRLILMFALVVLTLGAALIATPAVNQETWTVGLTVPILTMFLLPLSLLGSLLRPGRRHSRGGRS